jgi:hypothetical protein
VNVNTFVNALRGVGPLTLNSPTVLTLFGAPVVLSVPSTPSQAEQSSLSGDALPGHEQWYADGQTFRVRASGLFQPLQASKTYSVFLYYGNGLAIANQGGTGETELGAASGTLNAAAPFYTNWSLQADCLWDSASSVLNVVLNGQVNGVALTQQVKQVANVAAGALQFVVGGIANDSGVGQSIPFKIILNDFSAELV